MVSAWRAALSSPRRISASARAATANATAAAASAACLR